MEHQVVGVVGLKGWRSVGALVVALVLGMAAPAYAQTCLLRFAAENDFPPHLIKVSDQQWRGQSVELLQALAKKVGCQIQFVSSPWLRSLAQLKSGELDVISHLYKTTDREKDYYFIGPHHMEALWLIGRPEDFPNIKTFADTAHLKPMRRIAVLHGAYYGETFQRTRRDPQVAAQLVTISSIQDKLALLNAGRVEGILEDSTVLAYWKKHQAKQANLYQPITLVYQAPVYFGLSKTSISPELYAKLQQAWQELMQQQVVEQIQQQYH